MRCGTKFVVLHLLSTVRCTWAVYNTTVDDTSAAIIYTPAVDSHCIVAAENDFCPNSWTERLGPNLATFANSTVHTACGPSLSVTFAFEGVRLYFLTSVSVIGGRAQISIDGHDMGVFNARLPAGSTPEHVWWTSPLLNGSAVHTFIAQTPANTTTNISECFDIDQFVVASDNNTTNPIQSASAVSRPADKSSNVGTIVGAVVGGVLGLILLVTLIWCCVLRRRRIRPDGQSSSFFGNGKIIDYEDDPESQDSLRATQAQISPFRHTQREAESQPHIMAESAPATAPQTPRSLSANPIFAQTESSRSTSALASMAVADGSHGDDRSEDISASPATSSDPSFAFTRHRRMSASSTPSTVLSQSQPYLTNSATTRTSRQLPVPPFSAVSDVHNPASARQTSVEEAPPPDYSYS